MLYFFHKSRIVFISPFTAFANLFVSLVSLIKATTTQSKRPIILQVVSLDRLSRDYNDIKKLIQHLRDIGVTLIVDDLPQTNTGNPLVDQFMMDMMIQLMGFVAQNEREKIRERQAQGIKIAKAAHVYTGRKIKYGKNAKDPRNRWVWQTVVEDLKKENVPIASIAKKVGISRQQVYRIKKRENI